MCGLLLSSTSSSVVGNTILSMYQRSQHKKERRSYEEEGQRQQRQRHPPNLKGKEIGLFYARKQREKRQEEEEKAKDMLDIADDQIAKITHLISKIPHNASVFQANHQLSSQPTTGICH